MTLPYDLDLMTLINQDDLYTGNRLLSLTRPTSNWSMYEGVENEELAVAVVKRPQASAPPAFEEKHFQEMPKKQNNIKLLELYLKNPNV
jgi:hypothetical protein